MTIQDLMYYSDKKIILSYFVFVDFEKAFHFLVHNCFSVCELSVPVKFVL